MAIFKGSGVAIVTPFYEDGHINFDVLGELLEFHVANQTDAIIICGTTGEASTLTDEEQIEAIRYTVAKIHKRIPVIAGAGSNDTAHGLALCKNCQTAGADGLLLVSPYYNKTTQRGLIDHYTTLAAAVDIPIVLYNVPSRTGLNILPKTAYELSKVDHIVAIKEASGNISQIGETAALCHGRMDIYSGNDDQILPVLSLGGAGVISVSANVAPLDTHNMVTSFLNGDLDTAIALQLKAIPLVKELFSEVSPIPVKAALNMMGYAVGGYRKPLVPMEECHYNALKQAMQNYGLI